MGIATLVSRVLTFCYPRNCAHCDAWFEGDGVLCGTCDAKLTELECLPRCPACARPTGEGGACPRCQGRGLRPFERVVCMGRFDEPLRHLIHQAKYDGRWYLAEALADRMARSPGVRAVLADVDVVVPVPLFHVRRLARGYNQAEVLADRLRRGRSGVRLARPAVRWRATRTQTQLTSHAARVENVRDAFVLEDDRAVRDRQVLVVDDVMTSGATLQSLGRTLQEAAPASLSALVLAVADPKGRGFERI